MLIAQAPDAPAVCDVAVHPTSSAEHTSSIATSSSAPAAFESDESDLARCNPVRGRCGREGRVSTTLQIW